MSENQVNVRLCPVCENVKPANSAFSGKTCLSCRRWFSMNIDIYYHSPEGLVCPSNACSLFSCPQCRLIKFLFVTNYIGYNATTSTCYFCGFKTILKSSVGIVPKCSTCRKIHYDNSKRGSIDRCTCHERVDRMCDYCLFNKMNLHSGIRKQQKAASIECNKNNSVEGNKITKISLSNIPPQFREKAREQLVNSNWVVILKKINLDNIFHSSKLKNLCVGLQTYVAGPSFCSRSKNYRKQRKDTSEIRGEEAAVRYYNVVNVSDTRLVFQNPNSRKPYTETVNPTTLSMNDEMNKLDDIRTKRKATQPSTVSNRENHDCVSDEVKTGHPPQPSPLTNNNIDSSKPDQFRIGLNESLANTCPVENQKNMDENVAIHSPVLSYGTGQRHRNSKTVEKTRPFHIPLTSDVATQTESWSESAELEKRTRRILELEAIIASINLPHNIPTHKLQTLIEVASPSPAFSERVTNPEDNSQLQLPQSSSQCSSPKNGCVIDANPVNLDNPSSQIKSIEYPSVKCPEPIRENTPIDPDEKFEENVPSNSDYSGKSPTPATSVCKLSRRADYSWLLPCKVILNRLSDKELAQFQTERPSKRNRLDSNSPCPPLENESRVMADVPLCSQTEVLDYSLNEGDDANTTRTEDCVRKTPEKDERKSIKRKDRTEEDSDKEKKRSVEKKSSKEADQDHSSKRRKEEKSTSRSKRKKSEEKPSANPLSSFRIPRKTPVPVETEKSINDRIDFASPTIGLPSFLLVEHNDKDQNTKAESHTLKIPPDTHKPILNMSFKKSEQEKSVTFNDKVFFKEISPVWNSSRSPLHPVPSNMDINVIIDELRYSPSIKDPSDSLDANRSQQPGELSNNLRAGVFKGNHSYSNGTQGSSRRFYHSSSSSDSSSEDESAEHFLELDSSTGSFQEFGTTKNIDLPYDDDDKTLIADQEKLDIQSELPLQLEDKQMMSILSKDTKMENSNIESDSEDILDVMGEEFWPELDSLKTEIPEAKPKLNSVNDAPCNGLKEPTRNSQSSPQPIVRPVAPKSVNDAPCNGPKEPTRNSQSSPQPIVRPVTPKSGYMGCFHYMKSGRCPLKENINDKNGSRNCFYSHDVDLESCFRWILSLSQNGRIRKLKRVLDCILNKSSPFNKFLSTDWGRDVVIEVVRALVKSNQTEFFDEALSILANEELYFFLKYTKGYDIFHRIIMSSAPTLPVARKFTKIYKRIIADNLIVTIECWDKIAHVFTKVQSWKESVSAVESALKYYQDFSPSFEVTEFIFRETFNNEERLVEVCKMFALVNKHIVMSLSSGTKCELLAALEKFNKKDHLVTVRQIIDPKSPPICNSYLNEKWKQSQHQGRQVSDIAATTISDQGESVTEEMEKHLQKLERCFESNEINFVHLIEVFPQCYSGSHSDPIFMKLVQLINNSTLSTSPGSIVANIMKQYGSSKKCPPGNWPPEHVEALLDLCFFVLPNLFIDTNYDDAFNSIVLPLMWNLPIMEYIMKHRVSSRLLLFLARACIMNGDGPTAITFLTLFHKLILTTEKNPDPDTIAIEADLINQCRGFIELDQRDFGSGQITGLLQEYNDASLLTQSKIDSIIKKSKCIQEEQSVSNT